MASERRRWTRDELLVGLGLYLRLPFGQLHQRHPEIVACAELLGRTPSALAMKLTNLASLDDSLDRAGLANTSNADREIWAEMQGDWDATTEVIADAEARFGVAPAPEIYDDETFPIGEDILTTSKRRRGHDSFRRSVLVAYDFRCCVTGLSERRLLRVSHIAPWREDQPNRANPRNGLCLSAIHDEAFDRGLITLDADFRVLLSPQLEANIDEFVEVAFHAYSGQPISLPDRFRPDPELLAYHREHIFLASG